MQNLLANVESWLRKG